MAGPLQWVRSHWRGQITREDPETGPLRRELASPSCRGRPQQAQNYRNIAPCLDHFKKEYRKTSRKYKNNSIRTTRYTFWTFILKNVFEQCHRMPVFLFLILPMINWIPGYEDSQKEITMIPLLVALTIIAVKDALQDYTKYQSDKKLNRLLTKAYCRKEKAYINKFWGNITVGDIIQLSRNEEVPADMVVIHSTDADGICFIETSNIDGETNLQPRRVVTGFDDQVSQMDPEKITYKILCEPPNKDFNSFYGFVEYENEERIPLDKDNLLLRGCTIRNTDAVVGIVVYTGHETKVMLNNTGPRHKRSKLEKRVNGHFSWCVLILFLLCSISALGYQPWLNTLNIPAESTITNSGKELDRPVSRVLTLFWRMIMLLQVLIPVSLYLSLELVKLGQIYFIGKDIDFHHKKENTTINCRSSNIVEDLGQIQYVFSDKTGTLTENKMVFRRCSVAGLDYGHDANAEMLDTYQRNLPGSFQPRQLAFSSPMESSVVPDPRLQHKCHNICQSLYSDNIVALMESEAIYITEFFYALTLCNANSIYASSNPEAASESSESLELESVCSVSPTPEPALPPRLAQTPEEAALVHAARAYGWTVHSRSHDLVTIDCQPFGQATFNIKNILPFDSIRKTMSVIVKHPVAEKIVVYTKGADSSIMAMLRSDSTGSEKADEQKRKIKEETQKHVDEYARKGFRTLCVASKVMTNSEYEDWLEAHRAAERATEHREELLLESAARLESNLTLLGATGFEDRLQEGVPETMASLKKAGITVWMLTGDKLETAVNVAQSSNILETTDELFTIKAEEQETCEEQIDQILHEMKTMLRPIDSDTIQLLDTRVSETQENQLYVGLIIDGPTLAFALAKSARSRFLQLIAQVRAVICCRMTPMQKGELVKMMREEQKVMTLAIGDGANDISMIHAADVGIGITGQESMQAVMASDFAIPQFKHLKKVLLVHGHWCYNRLANMVLYFIYKNLAYLGLLFWQQYFTGFEGIARTDNWILLLFHLLCTFGPPIAYSILDKDVSADSLLRWPELYKSSQRSEPYLNTSIFLNIIDAIYQSLVCIFISFKIYAHSDINLFSIGGCMVFIVLLRLLLESKSGKWIVAGATAGSVIISVALFTLLSFICNSSTCQPTIKLHLTDYNLYLFSLASLVAALFPRCMIRLIKKIVSPTPIMRAEEIENELFEPLSPRRRERLPPV